MRGQLRLLCFRRVIQGHEPCDAGQQAFLHEPLCRLTIGNIITPGESRGQHGKGQGYEGHKAETILHWFAPTCRACHTRASAEGGACDDAYASCLDSPTGPPLTFGASVAVSAISDKNLSLGFPQERQKNGRKNVDPL